MGFFPVGRSYRSSAMRATTNRISSETLVVGRVVEFIFLSGVVFVGGINFFGTFKHWKFLGLMN